MSGPDDYKEAGFRGPIIVAVASIVVIVLIVLALSSLLQQCEPGECPGGDEPTPAALIIR